MSKSLRVLHVACLAPPEVGGIGMAALREVQGLRARGHVACLVVPEMSDEVAQMRPDGVRAYAPTWRVGNAARLPLGMILAEGWDVVHLHYPFYGTAEEVLLRVMHVPVVLTFHMDAEMVGWREWVARAHRMILQSWLLRRAKKILLTSRDYAASSSLHTLVAAHDPRLIELPFGIDLRIFCPRMADRGRFGLPQQGTIFLMVGGLDRAHAFKGVSESIRALAKLHGRDIYLAIRGDGELRTSFERLAEELGVRERVLFVPRCTTEELAQLFSSVDVLLVPSTSKAEAFGLVAAEAQACGVPVIASAWPGVRVVVRDGETGWLVPPGDVSALADRMACVMTDPDTIKRMKNAALQHAQQTFDQEQHLDRLLAIYRSVCASPS